MRKNILKVSKQLKRDNVMTKELNSLWLDWLVEELELKHWKVERYWSMNH